MKNHVHRLITVRNKMYNRIRFLIFFFSWFCTLNLNAQTKTIKCPLHYHDSLNLPCRIGSSYAQIMTYGYPNTYLHPGIDLLGQPGQKVYSVADGIVKAILMPDFHKSPDMWRIAITDGINSHETKGYLYAHLDRESIPVQIGDTVRAGDYIGNLVKWIQESYTHVHFSEIINQNDGVVWEGKWQAVRHQQIEPHGLGRPFSSCV